MCRNRTVMTIGTNYGSDVRMGYTGQVHDAETGLDNYHARYYDPHTGTFLSQ